MPIARLAFERRTKNQAFDRLRRLWGSPPSGSSRGWMRVVTLGYRRSMRISLRDPVFEDRPGAGFIRLVAAHPTAEREAAHSPRVLRVAFRRTHR
jgi:hypothetical protein